MVRMVLTHPHILNQRWETLGGKWHSSPGPAFLGTRAPQSLDAARCSIIYLRHKESTQESTINICLLLSFGTFKHQFLEISALVQPKSWQLCLLWAWLWKGSLKLWNQQGTTPGWTRMVCKGLGWIHSDLHAPRWMILGRSPKFFGFLFAENRWSNMGTLW